MKHWLSIAFEQYCNILCDETILDLRTATCILSIMFSIHVAMAQTCSYYMTSSHLKRRVTLQGHLLKDAQLQQLLLTFSSKELTALASVCLIVEVSVRSVEGSR